MKKILLLLILTVVLTGCRKSHIDVDFAFPQDFNSIYTLSCYASDSKSGFMMERGIAVQQGKCNTQLPCINPMLVYLSGGNRRIYFYAERGDKIEITGNNDNAYQWNIKGNKINSRLSEWRQANVAALASGNVEDINNAVAKYVKANPSDPVSTLLLLCDFDRRRDNALFLNLWGLLSDDAAEVRWTQLVSRNDMMTNTPSAMPPGVAISSEFDRKTLNINADGSIPRFAGKKSAQDNSDRNMAGYGDAIVLKTWHNGADTIRLGRQPVLFYFWRYNDPRHKENLDSLRALRRQRPDSTALLIVDVCFEADSVSWGSAIARDTLPGIIRAWTPLAESDPLIRRLSIPRTPLFLSFPAR